MSQTPGVPKEFQSTLFDKFQQTDKAGKPMLVRGGLDLALAKEIIDRHGGKIGVKGDQNEGCTFYFVLKI